MFQAPHPGFFKNGNTKPYSKHALIGALIAAWNERVNAPRTPHSQNNVQVYLWVLVINLQEPAVPELEKEEQIVEEIAESVSSEDSLKTN